MTTRTLLHIFPTFSSGGAQVRFATVVNHLGRTYRHRIVAMRGSTEALELLASEVDAEPCDVTIRPGNSLKNLRSFALALNAIHPDLLITHNWGSIEWAIANFATRVPHVHIEDGFGADETNRQFSRRVWTRRLVLRRSTVVVPSRRLQGIARDVWRLPGTRVFYVPNGINCARFACAPDPAFAASFGIRGDLPVIGTVARLSPEKNLRRLIDAFVIVLREHAAMLAIVGDGPDRVSLADYSARLGLENSVVFTGACSQPERLIPSFAVFALSSDTEQMPLSVLEAMAAGCPIAATAVGDIRDMVAEENQPFVVATSASALSTALLALMTDQGRAATIGAANARRAHDTFDQKFMFDQYKALFDGRPPTASEIELICAPVAAAAAKSCE